MTLTAWRIFIATFQQDMFPANRDGNIVTADLIVVVVLLLCQVCRPTQAYCLHDQAQQYFGKQSVNER